MGRMESAYRKLRFVLPIRTSKRKKEAKSPQQQRDLAASWEKAYGHEIVAVLDSGKDESGKTMDRATIHQAMEMVRSGEADGIVFALTDRLGRAPIEESMAWIRQLNLVGYLGLADAGGEPVRLAGGDPSRETALVIQLQIARQQWLATAARFRQSQRDAIKAGKFIGKTPLGFKRVKGRLRADETRGPVITKAYRLAARDGLHAAQSYLQAAVPEREWTTDHVRRVLRSRAYLGENRYRLAEDPGNFAAEDLVSPIRHDALTDLATWTAAQTDPRHRRSNGDYPLTHFVHCKRCGSGLVGALQTVRKGTSYRRMRCSGAACKGGCSMRAEVIEGYMLEAMKRALSTRGFRDRFAPDGLAEAETELAATQAERSALTAKVKPSHPDFSAWLAAADADVDIAQRRYLTIAGRANHAEDLPQASELHKPEQFARALRAATSVGRFIVRPGRGPITERVSFEPDRLDDVTRALAA